MAAEVIGLDMAQDVQPQYVPYAFLDPQQTETLAGNTAQILAEIKGGRDVRKGYWYCHEQYGSSAKMVYGNAHTAGELHAGNW